MRPNPTLPHPRTRLQKLAYYLVLGQEPAHAAKLAGYAASTVKSQAARLVAGKKVRKLCQVYTQRLGLLSDDALQEGLAALRRLMDSPNERTALTATISLIRLARRQATHPYRMLDLHPTKKADRNRHVSS